MKHLFAGMLVTSLIFLSGCQDRYNVPNPPMAKGTILNKEFVPSQSFAVTTVLKDTSKIHQAFASTPEMYLITIGTTENANGGYKIYNRSFYIVTPILFGELQIGQEVDFTDNKSASPATVN